MMNRRQFVTAAAAGAAMLARIPHAFAQTYELIIKGGRVIDPSVKFRAKASSAGPANCTTSISPMSIWRAVPSHAIAMSSSA
jgi:hypothetical protein